MAITEDVILGQDCTIVLNTATFTGTIVNWDEVSWGFERVTEDFIPGSSAVEGFVTPRKRIPPIRIRLHRGLGQTAKDIKTAFDDEQVTLLTITDFIADATEFAAMETEYGKCSVVSVNFTQPGGSGTAEVVLRFGFKVHGYSPVV